MNSFLFLQGEANQLNGHAPASIVYDPTSLYSMPMAPPPQTVVAPMHHQPLL